jgi:biopolymer transport protein ExbD/biopolymer transport protein TolR
MGMEVGGGGSKYGPRPAMNVTPLVDIVLVLLIIFMVITPLLNKQFWLHVPKKDEAQAERPEPAPPQDEAQKPVVLTVTADGQAWINKDPVADAELGDRLRRVFAARTDTILFFDAADEVAYDRAMQVMDLARGGGARTIAVLTERIAR